MSAAGVCVRKPPKLCWRTHFYSLRQRRTNHRSEGFQVFDFNRPVLVGLFVIRCCGSPAIRWTMGGQCLGTKKHHTSDHGKILGRYGFVLLYHYPGPSHIGIEFGHQPASGPSGHQNRKNSLKHQRCDRKRDKTPRSWQRGTVIPVLISNIQHGERLAAIDPVPAVEFVSSPHTSLADLERRALAVWKCTCAWGSR